LKPSLFVIAGLVVMLSSPTRAQMPDRTDPSDYSCSDFIGAGTPASRERAERMVYWAAGYVRGRLEEVATGDEHVWHFKDFSGLLTRALFEQCPGEPGLSIADMAEQIAHDLSHPGISSRGGFDDTR
jgi:hypothetical protein